MKVSDEQLATLRGIVLAMKTHTKGRCAVVFVFGISEDDTHRPSLSNCAPVFCLPSNVLNIKTQPYLFCNIGKHITC